MKGYVEGRRTREGEKRWRAGWRIGPRPAHGPWRNKRFKAEADLRQALHEIDSGQNWSIQRVSYRAVLEKWMELKRPNLKPSTLNDYQSAIDRYLLPRFGHYQLDQISPALLEDFIADLRNTGLKAKTIVEILRVLNQHFRYAVRRHHIRYNPLTDVEKPRLDKPEIDFLRVEEIRKFVATLPRDWKTSEQLQKSFFNRIPKLPEPLRGVVIRYYVQNQKVERIARDLSLAEGTVKSRLHRARQVLQFLPSRNDFHGDYIFFLIAILSGMRLGELLGLQWNDIDWETKKIRVRRALWRGKINGKWQWVLQRPKSKAALRDLDVSEDLLQELRKHRLACPKSHNELVFCTQAGEPLEARSLMRWHFEPALKRTGLRKIRFHDLRHTYASLLIAQKESPKYIQTQLGHASIKTTFDTYGHLMEETNPVAAARLSAVVLNGSAKSR